jgi:hypothetical protein
MPHIIFVQHDGTKVDVDAEPGNSVMQGRGSFLGAAARSRFSDSAGPANDQSTGASAMSG